MKGGGYLHRNVSFLQQKQEATVKDISVGFMNKNGVLNCFYSLDFLFLSLLLKVTDLISSVKEKPHSVFELSAPLALKGSRL